MSSWGPGDVVWVKCGQLFWPAKILEFSSLPDDVREDFNENNLPKVVAKFFGEDGYEFLFDDKHLYPYNCHRKEEFIKKGIVKSRVKKKEGAKDGWFSKFPSDVIESERLTGGDIRILEKDPFVERSEPRIDYKQLFGTPVVKNKKKSVRNSPLKKTGGRPIVHPRFREGGGGSDHQMKILPQPSQPYHLDLQMKELSSTSPTSIVDNSSSAAPYSCHSCDFKATRLNVIILHQKIHSGLSSSLASTTKKFSPTKKKLTPNTHRSSKTATNSASPRVRKSAKGKSTSTETTKSHPETSSAKRLSSITTKKGQMTQKQKLERVQKQEECKRILGDWDDEEEETEERKKMDESIKLAATHALSDDSGKDEEQIVHNIGGGNFHKEESAEEERHLVKQKNNVLKKISESSGAVNGMSRSVKFKGEEVSKKISLVQSKSDMMEPPENVRDEFDFSEEPELSQVVKPILKRPNRPPPKITSDSIAGSVSSPPKRRKVTTTQMSPSNKVVGEVNLKSPVKTISSPSSPIIVAKKSAPFGQFEESSSSSSSSSSPQKTSSISNLVSETLAVAVKSSSVPEETKEVADEEGETYILLVDEQSSQMVDSLNSQLLYLDSSSLVSGNVVLMTPDGTPATVTGRVDKASINSSSNPPAAATPTVVYQLPPVQEQAVVVGTKGGATTHHVTLSDRLVEEVPTQATESLISDQLQSSSQNTSK